MPPEAATTLLFLYSDASFFHSPKFSLQLFAVLAAILHMGNIAVKQRSRRSEDAYIPDDDTHLPGASISSRDMKELAPDARSSSQTKSCWLCTHLALASFILPKILLCSGSQTIGRRGNCAGKVDHTPQDCDWSRGQNLLSAFLFNVLPNTSRIPNHRPLYAPFVHFLIALSRLLPSLRPWPRLSILGTPWQSTFMPTSLTGW